MRHPALHLIIICVSLASITQTNAQPAVYQPLSSWVDHPQEAFGRWESVRVLRAAQALPSRTIAADSRPQLPGLRPRNVELLQDALLRKHHNRVKTPDVARQHILRYSQSQAGRNVLHGAMHEALYVDRNPEWAYVRKPNSPQHDIYRWRAGRSTPDNAQLKFHAWGRPGDYEADMRRDWRAPQFIIPDDHVGPLKEYLKAKAGRLTATGNLAGAKEVWRNYGRVRGSGYPSSAVTRSVRSSAHALVHERHATYVSLGASLALAVGPTIWDLAHGDIAPNQAMYRATRALSLLGIVVGTDRVLMNLRQGALRGTLRGNLIVGTALTITETTWLLYEHGWSRAFSDPSFYESMGGSVTALALGIAASGAAVAWVPGPGWVVGGTAIVAGVAAGTVGYIGGRSGTRMVLEILAPENLQQNQRERLAEVNRQIQQRIAAAQEWPVASH